MNGRITLRLLLLLALAGCDGTNPGDDGGTSSNPDGGTSSQPDGSTSSDPDGGTSSDPDGGTSSDPDGGTSTTGFACTTGTLFSGHPNFDAEPGVHANEGDPLAGVEGRPLGWREVIFVGTHIVTVVGQEVWASDLAAGSPTVHRVAGVDQVGQELLDGPCADARFANLQDLAADSAGALYVMDQTGNAILQITDPFDADACTVNYWAGTSTDTTGITPPDPPNVGETDGPGLSAQFALPGRMAIDDNDNLYVWDEGNTSIRKIASDASHTVSTLAPVESDDHEVIVDSMVVLDGVLYLYGHDTADNTFIQSVDIETGATADVIRGRADLFGFGSSDSIAVGGMATDGVDLFVYFRGVIFRVTIAGEIEEIAGNGDLRSLIEFESTYDPAASHPAAELQLANRGQYSTAGAGSWLAINDQDDIFFVGSVMDPYVELISCAR